MSHVSLVRVFFAGELVQPSDAAGAPQPAAALEAEHAPESAAAQPAQPHQHQAAVERQQSRAVAAQQLQLAPEVELG